MAQPSRSTAPGVGAESAGLARVKDARAIEPARLPGRVVVAPGGPPNEAGGQEIDQGVTVPAVPFQELANADGTPSLVMREQVRMARAAQRQRFGPDRHRRRDLRGLVFSLGEGPSA